MQPTVTTPETSKTRQAAITGLAVVGFIALILFGIGLGVYSARFVPAVANTLGSAAVYLGSVFTPGSNNDSGISVVPSDNTASTTISFGTSSSTLPVATTTEPKPVPKPKPTGTGTTPGEVTTTTYTTGSTIDPNGTPDLAVNIASLGYQTTSSSDSFVASSSVPSGKRPTVKFTVKNVGTNWSGVWRFTATAPTVSSYDSGSQISLAPGDSIDFWLSYDPTSGSSFPISITVNPDHTVRDTHTQNDTASATLTLQ